MEIPYYNSILDRFFDVLGLSPTSSFKELKSRYHSSDSSVNIKYPLLIS